MSIHGTSLSIFNIGRDIPQNHSAKVVLGRVGKASIGEFPEEISGNGLLNE
jgi:hypothetical protein